jgi:hypothetical protein
MPPSTCESTGAFALQQLAAWGKLPQAVDTAPQVAKLRAASGTRDSFNPAVRFQIVESQPELSSGLFSPEKRDFGVVLSQVHARRFGWQRSVWIERQPNNRIIERNYTIEK